MDQSSQKETYMLARLQKTYSKNSEELVWGINPKTLLSTGLVLRNSVLILKCVATLILATFISRPVLSRLRSSQQYSFCPVVSDWQYFNELSHLNFSIQEKQLHKFKSGGFLKPSTHETDL
jgi:hypothetical protein